MSQSKASSLLRNPVLLLAWGLPLVAVVASVLSLVVTLRHPDEQLPEQYHWEGLKLDRDFSRGQRAEKLRVNATLAGFATGGRCELSLRSMNKAPARLVLLLAHATKPRQDQRVTFNRVADFSAANGNSASYVGTCTAVTEGHWRMELIDEADGWAVRQSVHGSPSGVTIDAVDGKSD